MVDHKELIEKFCEEKGYDEIQKRFLMKEEIYEKDLFHLNPKEQMELILKDMAGIDSESIRGSKTVSYVILVYGYIINLYDWFVEKKYMEYNPYKVIPALNKNSIILNACQRMKVSFIDTDDIDGIVLRAESDRELYNMIIRLLYDGVRDAKELASIKMGNIDLNEQILNINKRIISLSPKTVDAIREYGLVKTGSRLNKKVVKYKTFLIKRAAFKMDFKKDEEYIESTKRYINGLLNTIGLSVSDISKSGIIKKLYVEFYFDYEPYGFYKFFFRNYGVKIDRDTSERIKKVGRQFGYNSNFNKLIDDCLPYIVNSKYYHVT